MKNWKKLWQKNGTLLLESELEQDEHPLEAEDDIPEDADSAESPISLNTLRQQMDETAVERISLAARTEIRFFCSYWGNGPIGSQPGTQRAVS